MRTFEQSEWLSLVREHEAFVLPWVERYRDRRGRGVSHPVHDFLFTYYQTNRQTLTRWRPMFGMRLLGEEAWKRFGDDDRYVSDGDGVSLSIDKMDSKDRNRVKWVESLLSATIDRVPRFNCFGLHEWAMVYKADTIRHEKTPLRVSKQVVERVVESMPLCCTHYDAYRFFTPEAVPLNATEPNGDERERNEQFGCVHFNMDLYRWSYKLSPWIGSSLMVECFKLAIEARALDMRASPYDVSNFGYESINIETAEGKELYRKEQQSLYEKGQPLAKALLKECRSLLESPVASISPA